MVLRTIFYASLVLITMPAAQAMNNGQKALGIDGINEICNQIEKMYESHHNATLERILLSSSDIITNPANRIFARCLLSQTSPNYTALALLIQHCACLSPATENTKILTIIGDILNFTETSIMSMQASKELSAGDKEKMTNYATVSHYLMDNLKDYEQKKRAALNQAMQPFISQLAPAKNTKQQNEGGESSEFIYPLSRNDAALQNITQRSQEKPHNNP